MAVREGLNLLGEFEDIVQAGAAQAQGAAVAVLLSESADIYFDPVGTHGSGLRTLYLALRHAELPVDIVTEDDAESGLLKHYDVLYVAMPHLTNAAATAIASWVSDGGSVFATASAGLLNEADMPNAAFSKLLGVTQSATEPAVNGNTASTNETVWYVKQDLQFVKQLDTVTLTAAAAPSDVLESAKPLVAKGVKSIFKVSDEVTTQLSSGAAVVLAKFADGSPAAIKRTVGKGAAFYAGFMPGLAYYDPAIPKRPVDRASVDSGFNHVSSRNPGLGWNGGTELFLLCVSAVHPDRDGRVGAALHRAADGRCRGRDASHLLQPPGGGRYHHRERPRHGDAADQLVRRAAA